MRPNYQKTIPVPLNQYSKASKVFLYKLSANVIEVMPYILTNSPTAFNHVTYIFCEAKPRLVWKTGGHQITGIRPNIGQKGLIKKCNFEKGFNIFDLC